MTRIVHIPNVPMRWDVILQKLVPTMDLEPATKFGDLEVMTKRDPRDSAAISEVRRKAASSVRTTDYILCVGDPVLIGVAVADALNAFGSCQLLRWNKTKRGYDVTVIEDYEGLEAAQ